MTCATKRGVSELKLSKAQSPNISLKENKIFFLFSQIGNQRFPTSLNNNIMPNFYFGSLDWRNKQ